MMMYNTDTGREGGGRLRQNIMISFVLLYYGFCSFNNNISLRPVGLLQAVAILQYCKQLQSDRLFLLELAIRPHFHYIVPIPEFQCSN
jgi:hypothetical protein